MRWAITLVSASLTFLLLYWAGPLFFILGAAVGALFDDPPSELLLVPYVVLPLVAVVFWRQPWWVRWVFAGFVLHNLALFGYLELRFPGPGFLS